MKSNGIVILNYNDSKTVIELVSKIHNYHTIEHIVIVDNCSKDTSYDCLKSINLNRVEVIRTQENGGYASGNNFGAKYLINRYHVDVVFIANPDIEFSEAFFTETLDELECNDEYSLLSGIVLDMNGKPVQSCWKLPSYSDDLFNCFMIARAIKKQINACIIDYSQKIMKTDVVMGSFFAINAATLIEIGFFDENTFLFYEENILASRMGKYSYNTGIITSISYKHIHSVSISKAFNAIRSRKILTKSMLYYETEYRKINRLQIIIMKVAIVYSIFETILTLPTKNIINHIKQLNNLTAKL